MGTSPACWSLQLPFLLVTTLQAFIIEFPAGCFQHLSLLFHQTVYIIATTLVDFRSLAMNLCRIEIYLVELVEIATFGLETGY